MNGIKSLLLAASRTPGLAAELAVVALRDIDPSVEVSPPPGERRADSTGRDGPPRRLDSLPCEEHAAPSRSDPRLAHTPDLEPPTNQV